MRFFFEIGALGARSLMEDELLALHNERLAQRLILPIVAIGERGERGRYGIVCRASRGCGLLEFMVLLAYATRVANLVDYQTLPDKQNLPVRPVVECPMCSRESEFAEALPRSPVLMRPADTGLLVVDLQERLVAVQPVGTQLVWNARRLLDGARLLGVVTAATEQYPEKLGPTLPELAERLSEPAASKLAFSAGVCGDIFAKWRAMGILRVLLCGVETHVCVQQTALDLLAAGFQVLVAVDAVGARFKIDHHMALRRLEASGALLTTTEAALFEWCEQAGTDVFQQISRLARETCPRAQPEIS